jgi:hypothetical protein
MENSVRLKVECTYNETASFVAGVSSNGFHQRNARGQATVLYPCFSLFFTFFNSHESPLQQQHPCLDASSLARSFIAQESPLQHEQFLQHSIVQHSLFFFDSFFAASCDRAAAEIAVDSASSRARQSSLLFLIVVLLIEGLLPDIGSTTDTVGQSKVCNETEIF